MAAGDLPSQPVDRAAFARAMTVFEPFEEQPLLAVAVSGGRDSLALAFLAADWAARRNGRIVALTVDHGLRAEAAVEARTVGGWLSARDIEHHILVWPGPHPQNGLQAAARDARYRLLEGWCAANGVLHLLLGHQSDDQDETYRMRRARQAAGAGLAGMPAIRETPILRILRPLLAFPRDRLAATLAVRGQPWVDDPSNEDSSYERSRVRAATLKHWPVGNAIGLAAESRLEADADLARAAARCVAVLPAGFVRLAAAEFSPLSAGIRELLLARCVMTVGGKIYPPRGDRLKRLAADIAGGRLGRGRTLGGCRIVPEAGTRGQFLLIVREAASMPGELAVVAGTQDRWDGRFEFGAGSAVTAGLHLGALGREGWRRLSAVLPESVRTAVPVPVRPTLPVVRRGADIVAAPHLGIDCGEDLFLRFSPMRALTDAGFAAKSV